MAQARKLLPFKLVFTVLIAVLIGCFLTSFVMGRYPVPPLTVLKIIFADLFNIEPTWTAIQQSVVIDVRIPRVILAICVGAGLAVSGAAFQGVFRNPLVSPDIMGVSSAAGFGASLAISFSMNSLGIRTIAFVFGILGVAMSYGLSRVHKTSPTIMMILAGIVVGSLFDAGLSIMKYMADPVEKLPEITFWLMGSLSSARWNQVAFAAPIVLAGIIILSVVSWKINLMSMGDAEARSMGVRIERMKLIIIVCATLVTATCVCVSGTIKWIGLVIPHIARSFVGPDHRKLIPTAALTGGIFLLVIDDISRTISSAAIPLGILTSLIGAPFFALLIRKTKGEWSK